MHNYDYFRILSACCPNIVGYIPIPLSIARCLMQVEACRLS